MSDALPETRATNRALFLPYALPYLLYVAVGLIPEESLPRDAAAGLRFLLAGGALAWGWRRYVSIRGPGNPLVSVLTGAAAGVAGLVLWVALVTPFAPADATPWSDRALLLRLLGATLLVPFIEEFLLRGYLLRLVVQRDEAKQAGEAHPFDHALDEARIDDVPAGAWTPLAIVVSTAAFALGHATHEWLAAVAYGLLMAALWIWRKDLLTCIVAHAVTNLTLALYIHHEGRWDLW